MKLSSNWIGAFCVVGGLWAGTALGVTVDVAADGLTFDPPDVTINVGDSVHWSNLGFHNVAQVDDAVDQSWNGGFRSGDVGDVTDYTRMFSMPGTFYYICEPHVFAGMRGSVTVNAQTPAASLGGMLAMFIAVTVIGGSIAFRRRQVQAA